jgi:hypothetical protein
MGIWCLKSIPNTSKWVFILIFFSPRLFQPIQGRGRLFGSGIIFSDSLDKWSAHRKAAT